MKFPDVFCKPWKQTNFSHRSHFIEGLPLRLCDFIQTCKHNGSYIRWKALQTCVTQHSQKWMKCKIKLAPLFAGDTGASSRIREGVPEHQFGHYFPTRLQFHDLWGMRTYRCITEAMWGGLERDAKTARTVNISSELVLMYGARHGFRDSSARMASSPPPLAPAFYYYWANITQALLIIHQHLSAKSHAEETRHSAAWIEIKAASVMYCEPLLICTDRAVRFDN